jgi:four helix bundle protein
MATVLRFEDLDVWKEARSLVKAVYSFTSTGAVARDFGIRDQLQRAAVSVMSNIAEGFERGTNKEFVQFLHIAKGSAGEVRSLLYAALDIGYLAQAEFKTISDSALSISGRLSSFIKYLQGRKTVPQPDNVIT